MSVKRPSDQVTLHRKLSLDEFLHHRRPTTPPPPSKGCRGMVKIQYANKKVRRYPLRNPPRPTEDQLNYCQVVLPITFQDNDSTFYMNALSVGGAGPFTPASASADQATPELTKTATDAPNSATTMALEVNHFSLNLILTTGLDVQELTVNTDSDVTPAGSFGENDNDLNYLKSKENLLEIENTNSDLLALIEKLETSIRLFTEI